MSIRPRLNISTTISASTRTQRFLIITFGFVLALGGVAISKSPALRETLGFSAAPKPFVRQQAPLRENSSRKIDLLRILGVNRAFGQPLSLASPLVPTVSATKTDALFTDVDGDLQADPGDTLTYTVNVNASGDDATGVTFTDTVDPNTAFVPGSLTATPVAVDDTYAATGNVRISVAAPGVLGNDFAGVPNATITAPPITSTNGGNVTLNADGSFTYNPPAGFEGTDTFSYTLTNTPGSNSATVTINVSGMIWFINNTAAACTTLAGGCGRLTNPFSSLSAFASLNNGSGNNPAANDNIFLYESAADYFSTVTLLNGQRFIGQDATASLSAITGLTPPSYSDPLPAMNSGNATIVNITSAGNSITVASGNTLRGFTGGNSVTDIFGTSFGTLTIADVTLNGAGQALNLTTGTLAATFNSISSNSATTTGISLTGVAGSLTNPSTTIVDPVGIGLSVNTSSASLSFGNTSSTLSGGAGVSLLTNTGTITFGALNISPDPNQKGLVATDNSNTITSTSGTISNTGATAVEITRASGTTPLVISLTAVSSSGGAGNGIILSNTAGSFTVAGTGAAASGGTIANKTGANGSTTQGTGIFLNNTTNISLSFMSIQGHQNHGIRGNNVTGFTLDNSVVGTTGVNGNSNTADVDPTGFAGEGSIRFYNLLGSATISNSTLDQGFSRTIAINNDTGTLNRLTITNCTVRESLTAATATDSLFMGSTANAVVNSTINGASQFSATHQFHIQTTAVGTSTMDIQINGGNVFSNSISPVSAGGGLNFQGAGTDSLVTFNINGNSFRQGNGAVVPANVGRILTAGMVSGAGKFDGKFTNNTVGVSGIARSGGGNGADSLGLFASGDRAATTRGTGTTDSRFLIQNNIIKEYGQTGILISADSGGAVNASVLDATVFGNTINEPDAAGGAFAGIWANSGALPADTNTVNIVIGSQATAANKNTLQDSDPNDFSDVFLENDSGAGTFNLFRNGSAAGTEAGVIIDDNNPTLDLAGISSGTINLVGGAPPPPLRPQGINDDPAPASGNDASSEGLGTASDSEEEDILRVAKGENPDKENPAKLTQAELSALMPAAIERWRETGISFDDLVRLQAVTFEITDLPEGQLASANSTSVKIDETAAEYGWYSDVTPMEDSEFAVPVAGKEFQATESSAAFGRMDLLTVLMRELGTVYLQGKKLTKQLRPLMEGTLSPAVRRLPNSLNVQLAGSPVGVSGRNRSGSEKSLVSQISKRSALRAKTGVSASPVSFKNAPFKPIAQTASHQSSRLMHHAPRTLAPLSMLADVMLNIGTLPAGESVTITFNVTVDDPFTGALPQVSNQGTVSGSNFSDVLTDDPTVGGTADPTVTPIDLPQVSLAVSPASVSEDGATNLVYTVTRTGSTANAMTVNFSVGGTASFTEPDYTQTGAATFTATSGTVVIPGGSSTATVTINPSADTTVEPDETVDLTVTSGTGYTVGAPSAASGTITNDDADVSVAVSPGSVAEDGATNLVYTFTRTGFTGGALTVNFSVGGSADFGASPNDYTQTGAASFTPTTGSVTFGAGNSTATVTVNPETDTTIETDETVILTLTSGAGYNISSPSSATGTITNDDADVSVAVAPASVAEDGATNLVYTFTRTGFTGGPLTVNFSVGGSATFGVSPDDYTQTGATTYTTTTGTVTFTGTNSTATVTVDPETDTTAESDETVVITLTAGASYNVVSPSSATGTILNDDTLVSVVVAPSSTAEGGANMVYTFTRSGPTTGAVTANFSVGGSASFPGDYSQSGATTFTPPTATVTFGVGSSTATVTVTPLTDCAVEGSETVVFTVQAGTGYGVGSPNSATGTITNTPDSSSPTITLIPNVNVTLWPPNHQYETVAVTDFVASASDNCDPTVNVSSVYILKITSDEAENGNGDGNTLNDIVIAAGCKTAQLRSERDGSADGRVYTITFKVKDATGNFATATAQVTVRKSPNKPAVDSGTAYTVNSACP